MAGTAAERIALCRALWPQVTTAAASDAFLTSWLDWAVAFVDDVAWGFPDADVAVAHLLAHVAYRVDPAAELGTGGAMGVGAIASLTTLRLSASFGAGSGASSAYFGAADAELATTRPGSMFLALRGTHAAFVVPVGL